MIVTRVDELHAVTLAICDGSRLRVGNNGDALRLLESRQALEVPVAFQVEHFHSVVPERCDIQSLRSRVDRQVIDASLDTREIDRAHEYERHLA